MVWSSIATDEYENIARRTRGTGWFRNSLWRGFTKFLAGKGFFWFIRGWYGGVFYIYPSVRLEACGVGIANMGVYLCIVLLAPFPFSLSFRLRFVAWENIGFEHFLFISLPSTFPSSFFSCLHHFLLISPSGSTFISPLLLLPPRAIVW